jgi:hypothetical protein
MTIKKSGGIFGRNPTFNDVEIEGTLTSSGLTVDTDTLHVDAVNNRLGIGTTSPGEAMHLYKASGDPAFRIQSSAGNCYVVNRSGTSAMDLLNSMNGPMTFATNNGERLRILAGGGITFNGDTAAANALDDYEEGTFTHAVTCSTSGTISVAGAYDTGSYVKVGNKVTAQGLIIMTAISSPVGVLNISLPFVAATGSERAFDTAATVVINNSVANTAGSYVSYVVSNTQTIQVFEGDSASFGSLSANQIQASSTIWYNVTYRAA